MENRERELYDKLIKIYEEKIEELTYKIKELERQLPYQTPFNPKIDPIQPHYPWTSPNDWPYNQPYWGITDPRNNEPIGPQYVPEWLYRPSTTGTPPMEYDTKTTVMYGMINPGIGKNGEDY